METFTSLLELLAAIVLGLTAGALLAEGAILVPFWRSATPEFFLGWYKQHAALLQNFFGPLEVAAAVLTILAAAVSWFGEPSGSYLLMIAAVLVLLVLAVFPIYFQRANTSFAKGTIATDRVAAELRRWASWHWARTVIAVAAFIAAVLA